MKNHIMTYNQLNESNELANLSFEEVGRLIDLGLIELSSDLLYIYDYVKNGSIGCLYLTDPKMKYLPSWLTKVDGSLYIADSGIEDIPDTLEITKNIAASYSKLKEFRKTKVFGYLDLAYTQITKLPDGLSVDLYLSVEGIQFEEIPKNLTINDDFYVLKSNLMRFSSDELHKMYEISGSIIRN